MFRLSNMLRISTTRHTIYDSINVVVAGLFVVLLVTLMSSACLSYQANPDQTAEQPMQRPEIERRQQKLLDDYHLLEEKLFTLYQYEKDKNPTRSKLLEKAYQRSQQSATIERLEQATGLLSEAKLKQAEAEQAKSLNDLNSLLALLQSEDRGKRIADELERYQEYLKEVERLLRIQKGLRGQTEGGGDEQKIAQSEAKAAERAQKLADEIKRNEEQPTPGLIEEAEADDSQDSDDVEDSGKSNKSNDPESDGEPKPSDDSAEESESSESQPAGDQSEQEGAKEQGENSDNQNSSDQDSEPQDGDAKPADASAQPSEGDSANGDSESQEATDQQDETPPENPIRKRIANAEDRMRDAQQKLQQDKRDDAVEEMRAAEKEIAEAKKQLEEILRQLREEEVERTLAKLEGRFRKMLQREMEVKEATEKLNQTADDQRATDFDIQTGKLSAEQNSIATDASRALLLLREDGSSVAFPATVEEMHFDMLQIAARLSAAKVGEFTLELQKDVIGTLNYLVEALAQAQKDKEEEKSAKQPPGGGPPPSPGEEALVGKIAELKMLRGLQDRILQRHSRYAKSLESDDPAATTDSPDLIAGLKRLAEKQQKLTRIAQDIVNERNK